jgi:hypothetical protein
MPLIAVNLDEARSAYAALESRAVSAELNLANLRQTVDTLTAKQADLVDRAKLLTSFTVDQAQSNAQLLAQQAGEVSPDIGLDNFIGALGLAIALGEASMPDRCVNSVSTTLQAYLTLNTDPEGVAKVVGIRFYQPELGQPTALATASFEISKIPPEPGVPAPRSLYSVLQSKQAIYTDPFWLQFSSGTPPSQPAVQVITAVAGVLANIGGWTFPLIVQAAAAVAASETTLAGLLVTLKQRELESDYANAVAALISLTAALNPATRSNFVAGDLYALTAALDATTRLAQRFMG